MNIQMNGYCTLQDILSEKVSFSTLDAQIFAAQNLIETFYQIHKENKVFQNISPKKIWIDPKTGKLDLKQLEMKTVLDLSNVDASESYPYGSDLSYVAPEQLTEQKASCLETEGYVLAVLLFQILCGGHPLIGHRWVDAVVLTKEVELDLFGRNPIFVFDKEDRCNRPSTYLHKGMIAKWNAWPQFVKDFFMAAFCKDALLDKKRRTTEVEWIELLCRMRSSVATCSCGTQMLIQDYKHNCPHCGNQVVTTYFLSIPDYELPCIPGRVMTECQLWECSMEDATKEIGTFVQNVSLEGAIRYGLKNQTDDLWRAITPSHAVKEVQPGSILPIKPDIHMKIKSCIISVITKTD